MKKPVYSLLKALVVSPLFGWMIGTMIGIFAFDSALRDEKIRYIQQQPLNASNPMAADRLIAEVRAKRFPYPGAYYFARSWAGTFGAFLGLLFVPPLAWLLKVNTLAKCLVYLGSGALLAGISLSLIPSGLSPVASLLGGLLGTGIAFLLLARLESPS